MEKANKIKNVFSVIFNAVFTTVFIFTLFITFKSSIATFQHRLPEIFGYSVSEIQSGSMEPEFKKDDFVITKIVDASEIKVGDIIVFYVYPNKRPMPNDVADRSEMRVIFHQVIEVKYYGEGDNVETYFTTKGTNNSDADDYDVPFSAVAGKYIEANKVADFFIMIFLKGNSFLYWIIACLALVVLKQAFTLFSAGKEMGIQSKVIKGRLNLLDKKCFDKSVFAGFTNKEKNKLIQNAPQGMGLLYEFLLYGKVTQKSDAFIAESVKGKRFVTVDALCLTHANEPCSSIKRDEYIESLPKKSKDVDKYTNVEDYKQKAKAEKLSSWAAFAGCLLFGILYYTLGITTGSFKYSPWYEIYPIVIIPIFAALYLMSTISGCNKTEQKLLKQLSITPLLPDCYLFILRPYKFTSKEIAEFAEEIEKRQLAAVDFNNTVRIDGTVDTTPEVVDFDFTTEDLAADEPDAEPSEAFLSRKNRDTASIESRLVGTSYECLERYSLLKNQILAFKNVKSRLSSKYDTFRKGRIALVRMAVRGNTLRVYFNLDPRVLDTRFYIRDVSDKKIFAEFPALLNVRSTRSFNYAVELINKIAEVYDLSKLHRYEYHDYAKDFEPDDGGTIIIAPENVSEVEESVVSEIVNAEKENEVIKPIAIEETASSFKDEDDKSDDFIKNSENRDFISFQERLDSATLECRDKYNVIKNELLSYHKVGVRRNVRFDTFRANKLPLARITVRGDILRLYLSLDPKDMDAKYFIKDVSDKKLFEEFPSLLNVRSNRSFNYALELIRMLMFNHNLTKNHAYKQVDYLQMPVDSVDDELED